MNVWTTSLLVLLESEAGFFLERRAGPSATCELFVVTDDLSDSVTAIGVAVSVIGVDSGTGCLGYIGVFGV